MEVKINKEIQSYSESLFFGLSLRQCGFSLAAVLVSVGLCFLLKPYVGTEVKTTGEAGGLHRPYKGLIQPRLKTHERFANRKFVTGCPLPGAALYLPLTTGSPVNGSLNSLRHIWSLAMSS